MNPELHALAAASRSLMMDGDVIGAEKVLSPVFKDLKSDPTVLHLMGLIKKAQGQMGEAERLLRAAIAQTLNDGGYYNDLGVLLQGRGAYDEAVRIFRAAIALMPEAAPIRVNLVRCYLAAGKDREAEEAARAYIDALPSADSWTMLGIVQRAQGRFDAALASAERAYALAPEARGMRQNYAVALDRVGRVKEALIHFEALAMEDLDTPELAVNLARALNLAQRGEDAEAVLEQALIYWPEHNLLHNTLARLRWGRGAGTESTAFMEETLKQRPEDVPLRLNCADILHRGGLLAQARRVLEEGLRHLPDSPALNTSLGIVVDEMGDVTQGLALLRRAAKLAPQSGLALQNMAPTLLRAGAPQEALRIIRAMRQQAPDDQEWIAYEALALRMMSDSGYRHINDYDRLIRTYEIKAPRGYFTIDNFNASLGESLAPLFQAPMHPLDTNVREGAQTSRNLLECDDPNIRTLFTALEGPIKAYVGDLPGSDLLSRRKAGRYNFVNAWSVRQRRGGHQVNHVHTHGWISGTYYVRLPPDVADTEARGGWLKFGEPRLETPGCTPDAHVQPREGMLVLYPSYLWHGTIPFTRGEERLSVSFDVVPA